MVAIESQWLLWKINVCYGKSLDAMESHWVLKKSMVAIKSLVAMEVSMVAMQIHWLL
jgi:hypothetical protein